MSFPRSLAPEYLHHPVSLVNPTIAPLSFPCHPGSSIQIGCRLEGSSTKACRETGKESTNGGRCQVTIDILPDLALLEIFDCYVNQARNEEIEDEEGRFKIQQWHTLVHVCRKWRTIVLGSPRRLDLRLLCMDKTPVKETLAVWPPLPIVIREYRQPTRMDNIIVALEHNDRVCQIDLLNVTNSQLEEVLAAMQQPFPALMDLVIWWCKDELLEEETPLVVPASFLGGSAPRLQHLGLERFPFPGLPKLLLSATDLVSVDIFKIPHSGYISPEAMVACLSTLTRLGHLSLEFESPLSRPVRERRRPHPPTWSPLPALTYFLFEGVSEYLEDLVAWIDAPLLDRLYIKFFHQLIFDTPQLVQFVARTPNIQPPVEAHVVFTDCYVGVTSSKTFPTEFALGTSCRQSDWQLSFVSEVCRSSLPEAFICTVECLYITGDQNEYNQPRWQDDIEDSQWVEVLHPFTAVKDLRVSREFVPRIAPALQELAGERVTEELPALQSLVLEEPHPSGPVREAIKKFVNARRLAGRHIVVSYMDEEQDEELEGNDYSVLSTSSSDYV